MKLSFKEKIDEKAIFTYTTEPVRSLFLGT